MKCKAQKKPVRIVILLYVTLYTIAALLIVSALRYRQAKLPSDPVQIVNTVSASVDGGPWQTVTLPHTFDKLPPRTAVALKTDICPDNTDCLCVKSIFAPATVTLDGRKVLSLGETGSYPGFFSDPPPEIRLLEIGGNGQNTELEINFLSPASRNFLTVDPLFLGPSKDILYRLASRMGAPMVLALVQIIIGCILLFISICLALIDVKSQVFLWLGLFSKFSGIWLLCENDFSILCFKNDSLLYLLSCIGFISFIVPMLRFFRISIVFTKTRLLLFLEAFSAVGAILAMVLQFAGLIPFTKSMEYFRFTIPVTLILTMVLILQEAFRYSNTYARKLSLPIVVLALTSLETLLHLNIHVPFLFSSLFQSGMFLFLLIMSFFAGLGIRDSISLKQREEQLQREKQILQIQTEEQREDSLRLAKSEQEMSRQRHDLRHHLAAIQELSGDNQPLQEYLATLMAKIPGKKERFCANTVVNAIVSHYASLCEQQEIPLDTKLTVPETDSQSAESDLCVIFANLLENAEEACGRMTEGKRFIRITSSFRHGVLTIVMENSCSGEVIRVGDQFLSSKRNDCGIGLSSIRSIAEAAHGGCDFHMENHTFISSVYLCISQQDTEAVTS